MSHTCSTLIISCMDFRLQEAIVEFAKSNGLANDYDLVSIAGSIKNLVKPNNPTDADLVLKQIEISVNLHGIKNVVIVSHEDCGAYGGKKSFENDEAEQRTHTEDMEKAKQMILDKFPGLNITVVNAKLVPESNGSKFYIK